MTVAENSSDETSELDPTRRWHMAQTPHEEALTAFEFTLLQVEEAFRRWCVQASRLVHGTDLSFNEIIVLHVIRMQERPKDTATIAKLVNRDDVANVQYNLRKLAGASLIEKGRLGSTTVFEVTEKGREVTDRYAELRQSLLMSATRELVDIDTKLAMGTRFMKMMTGIYDGAARGTATINPTALFAGEAGPPEPADGVAAPRAKASRSRKR
ncbi:winged helix DNA-binding protein [Pseudonocardia asaccharolytica]|uniref:HTH marR-type domain-containing protein n=1 Tax=Pseudonocardia asaccharolytica DSM 44247 = NBRC 16224 TaxID=1123024 RepID=A0A511D4Y0_9PSEU|nr:winged helix DNA-binding protein [Pseudonocardia asaccharolytica]GEL19856.1 hypothetical protein PA7_36930 [Pseudonocardia asaccharolytica DSM 44247 = NBRC 16224]